MRNCISLCLKIPPQVHGTCPEVSLYTSILNALSVEWHLASAPAPWGKYTRSSVN